MPFFEEAIDKALSQRFDKKEKRTVPSSFTGIGLKTRKKETVLHHQEYVQQTIVIRLDGFVKVFR